MQDKYHLTLEQNLYLAKRNLSVSIWQNVRNCWEQSGCPTLPLSMLLAPKSPQTFCSCGNEQSQ